MNKIFTSLYEKYLTINKNFSFSEKKGLMSFCGKDINDIDIKFIQELAYRYKPKELWFFSCKFKCSQNNLIKLKDMKELRFLYCESTSEHNIPFDFNESNLWKLTVTDSNLETLNLSSKTISEISIYDSTIKDITIRDMQSLCFLYILDSKMTSLTLDIDSCNTIDSIYLRTNHINNYNIHLDNPNSSLKTLSLVNSDIHYLPKNIFNSKNIMYLLLTGCTKLDFSNLIYDDLKELSYSPDLLIDVDATSLLTMNEDLLFLLKDNMDVTRDISNIKHAYKKAIRVDNKTLERKLRLVSGFQDLSKEESWL